MFGPNYLCPSVKGGTSIHKPTTSKNSLGSRNWQRWWAEENLPIVSYQQYVDSQEQAPLRARTRASGFPFCHLDPIGKFYSLGSITPSGLYSHKYLFRMSLLLPEWWPYWRKDMFHPRKLPGEPSSFKLSLGEWSLTCEEILNNDIDD